jgi:acyl carrier protein
MNDEVAKLEKCFLRVFPDLNVSTVQEAKAEVVSGWDSLAHVTLLSLIGEEFGISVDFETFEGALSFDAILARIRSQSADA